MSDSEQTERGRTARATLARLNGWRTQHFTSGTVTPMGLEVLLLLMALMTALIAVARRSTLPYPIFLLIAGLVISFFPGLPDVRLESEVVFLLFLPPILVSAAFYTPIRDFKQSLRPILLLSVGCVLFTTVVVGLVMHALIPALPLAAAFALGAIVAPPDAIAATSIAERLGLPRRIVTVLEGESLVNDATALIAYRVAVSAAVSGAFSLAQAGLDFVVNAVGGLVVGAVMAWLVNRVLTWLDDVPTEILVTLVNSFLTYFLAERLHVSGVIACVTLGFAVGLASPRTMSAAMRIQAGSVWEVIVLALNGLAFVLIGLQLPSIIARLEQPPLALLSYALAVSATVILARIVWVFPASYLPRLLVRRIRERDPVPSWKYPATIAWTGMRGIVSLAAALALPEDFPARDLVLFLTFSVILATLLGQGLSLIALIRAFNFPKDDGVEIEETKARFKTAMASLRKLEELAKEPWVNEDHVQEMRNRIDSRQRRFQARFDGDGDGELEGQHSALTRLQDELIEVELQTLVRLRNTGVIGDEAMRRVQRDLDLERMRLGSN
jgi:CPA1 family monovalent cation:H+ antiporter